MTIQEFLDTHLPTRKPKDGDVQRAWPGWIANLYVAATGNDITLAEVTAAMEAAGYEATMTSFFVSKAELGRVDRRFAEKMLKNRRDGRGV
jgi:microcompartment protein CcmL/EutN